MFDLALSQHGDLVMAGNSDFAGISGSDLLEQRMRIRLSLHRDSWEYDTDGTLGSFLFRLIGMSPDEAGQAVEPYVREALRPMSDEISIDEVWHEPQQIGGESPRSIIVIVVYHVTSAAGEISTEADVQRQLQIALPLGGF